MTGGYCPTLNIFFTYQRFTRGQPGKPGMGLDQLNGFCYQFVQKRFEHECRIQFFTQTKQGSNNVFFLLSLGEIPHHRGKPMKLIMFIT